MMRSTLRLAVLVLLLGTAAAPGWAARAQGRRGGAEGGPAELRRAMQQYFQKRLRAEVSLSDTQVDHILPRVTRLEEAKSTLRRSRMEVTRRLRLGLEQGATDDELRELLDRLDRAEREQRELERSVQKEIEEVLSARQRVQLRFFMQHFRQEMQRKVQEFHGDRYRDPRRDPRRRPRRDGP